MSEKSKEKEFWEWFSKQEDQYVNLSSNRRSMLNKLVQQLHKVNKNLTFEFGEYSAKDKHSLIISAGGIISAFPAVKDLVGQAPELKNFEVIAFRQRKPEVDRVHMEQCTLSTDEIFFDFEVDEGTMDLDIFIEDYNGEAWFKQGAYILMDSLLGEYDLETKIGAIIFRNASEGGTQIHKLNDLPLIVDEYYKKR